MMSFDRQLDDPAGDAVRNESSLCKEPGAYGSEQPKQGLPGTLEHRDVQNRLSNAGMSKLMCVRGIFSFILHNNSIWHDCAALFKYCMKTNLKIIKRQLWLPHHFYTLLYIYHEYSVIRSITAPPFTTKTHLIFVSPGLCLQRTDISWNSNSCDGV